MFACHLTTGLLGKRAEERHCAGALIFAEKHGCETQAMQLARRLGFWDPARLAGHDLIFDSLPQMLRAALTRARRPPLTVRARRRRRA